MPSGLGARACECQRVSCECQRASCECQRVSLRVSAGLGADDDSVEAFQRRHRLLPPHPYLSTDNRGPDSSVLIIAYQPHSPHYPILPCPYPPSLPDLAKGIASLSTGQRVGDTRAQYWTPWRIGWSSTEHIEGDTVADSSSVPERASG
eukprot:2442605-Rhodomonas_salina.1